MCVLCVRAIIAAFVIMEIWRVVRLEYVFVISEKGVGY